MIYHRPNPPLTHNRYEQHFEYMFILSKGIPKVFNPILEKKLYQSKGKTSFHREKDGIPKIGVYSKKNTKIKGNVWEYKVGGGVTKDKIAHEHPAIFPDKLARDHIISWSNKNNVVLDPMCGSGTTLAVAEQFNRKWIGIEITKKYCEIAKQRIQKAVNINNRHKIWFK